MSRFLRAVQNDLPKKEKVELLEHDLKKCGLTGVKLRSYQLDGVRWLAQCMKTLDGCILGDEMGLGKTCQAISLMLYAQGRLRVKGPFMVLCPLTVMDSWMQELKNICPSLRVMCYAGDKKQRAELQRDMEDNHPDIFLTYYQTCQSDASILKRWKWNMLVVDEAQRLKNENSKLYQALTEFSLGFRLLLTGTPIQNNLQEVYSLLSFIQPDVFPPDASTEFVRAYTDVQTQSSTAKELHQVLQPFLLRRVKAEVETELPKKIELVVYHGMSALQKKFYKAILMKDLTVFGSNQGNENRLLNILMQLRKCVAHPYLFKGVEPEPFEIGEHLVEASGKLTLLDPMLAHLFKEGHRVLLFSQMTSMLDIVQDYLEYRGYSYERLDGSVRGEERFVAVNNFKAEDVFIFLLSTKAGGVGLTLTAADTVIFLDSDFNPQNDVQAAARAHRIGQKRPVKVIRLLARDTVEEIIYSRAVSKLNLTNTVIEEGKFSLLNKRQAAAADQMQLSEILRFGVHKLLSSDESSIQQVNVAQILGETRDGKWVIKEELVRSAEEEEDEDHPDHMYYFEGKDYSKIPSVEDEKRFKLMVQEHSAPQEHAGKAGRSLRHKVGVLFPLPLPSPMRPKRPLTESELEERRRKREEAAAKRAKLQEEKKKQREEKKYKRKMAWWESSGYKSLCLPSADSEGEDVDEEDDDDISSVNSTDSDDAAIHYVLGDVTQPQADRKDAIIVHCVDDSGHWGKGGLFTALEIRTDEAKKQYELAGDMEDLELGNVLLFSIDDKLTRPSGRDYLALIVAQKRDKANKLSGIYLTALDEGLKKIYRAAKQKKASVHLPRIGHATKGFNWYGTERLIRKHLASRGVPTFIYYFKRPTSHPTPAVPSTSGSGSGPPAQVSPGSSCSLSPPTSPEGPSTSQQGGEASGLDDFMRGVHVFFYNVGAMEKKTLTRYLITYDGDEEDLMCSQVTHIVAEVETPVHIQELQDLCQQYPNALLVKTKWLESCFANQKKVGASKFIHHFK
ncbi:chromodomain-helicase-DNA-binding protein 1-like [Clarias gariepinus]|uniref:chromodomain-helicase-DNA-binding protein 1-like n=1 Tax=Clarias gariepinus TaxID=13013 RepID=UPI00234D81F9|nr:chromodomain-helicase-DNA-binding protein 1-like [Clarias gariepinus]